MDSWARQYPSAKSHSQKAMQWGLQQSALSILKGASVWRASWRPLKPPVHLTDGHPQHLETFLPLPVGHGCCSCSQSRSETQHLPSLLPVVNFPEPQAVGSQHSSVRDPAETKWGQVTLLLKAIGQLSPVHFRVKAKISIMICIKFLLETISLTSSLLFSSLFTLFPFPQPPSPSLNTFVLDNLAVSVFLLFLEMP